MRPIHSAVNPLYVPKKEKKDHSSSSEEKNKSLASIVPGKVRLELVEVCYAETLENQSREPEGFLGARPSIPFSPRREKYLSEEGTPPSYRKTGQGASRIEVLQSRIPGKGLPPPIPLLSLSSDSGVNNVEFPKTAPPPTEDVSKKDQDIKSPRSKFTIPAKVSSERRPQPQRTTVRKPMNPIVHQSEGGDIVSPRLFGADILPVTPDNIVISLEPSGTPKPEIELTLTNPQDHSLSARVFPGDTEEFVERNDEFFEEPPQNLPKIDSGHVPKDPRTVASSRGTEKKLCKPRMSVTPSKIVAPANSWKMADTVGGLIKSYKGDRPESFRVLNILYCTAGAQTMVCAPTMYPETDACATSLTQLPENKREDYLSRLYNQLKEYLSQDQQEVISNHLEKIGRGRETANLRNLLMNFRSDLAAFME